MTRALALIVLAVLIFAAPASADPGQPKDIIGGYLPHASQWPWATLLIDTSRAGGDFNQKFCTATLISPTRVLTAGHCVAEDERGTVLKDPRTIQALVGRRRASDPSTGERIGVSAIAIHPKYYAPESGTYKYQAYYDLAVLFLERPASARPAEIGGPNDFASQATAMGWGHTNHEANITSDDLLAVDLAVWTDAQCSAAVDTPQTQYYFPAIHICAGGVGETGVCHGDSGGALMTTKDGGRTWKQIGVTSFYPPGSHCTSPGHPTGFAWVAGPTLRDWPLTVPQPTAPVTGPAPTPDPQVTPQPAPRDTTAPAATVTSRSTLRPGTIRLTVQCPAEACTATANGVIRVLRGARRPTYTLPAARHEIAAGSGARFSWRLPSGLRASIRRALGAHKGVAATLQVTVADAAGNRRTVTRSVRFTR